MGTLFSIILGLLIPHQGPSELCWRNYQVRKGVPTREGWSQIFPDLGSGEEILNGVLSWDPPVLLGCWHMVTLCSEHYSCINKLPSAFL